MGGKRNKERSRRRRRRRGGKEGGDEGKGGKVRGWLPLPQSDKLDPPMDD